MPKHAWVLGLLFISSLAEARWYQPEHAELGKPLYEKHCASCLIWWGQFNTVRATCRHGKARSLFRKAWLSSRGYNITGLMIFIKRGKN